MPRGHALGVTFRLPEMDKVSVTRKEIEADIDVCMGGKVAEEIIYGHGREQRHPASHKVGIHDGMSELLGNVDLEHRYKELSAQTKQQIESEVRRFVEEGRNRVYTLLTDNKESLERLANALVEYETLNKSEMEAVVRGEPLPDKLKINPGVPIKIPERKPAKNGGFVMPTSSKPLQKTAESAEGKGEGSAYPVESA
ncbi:i-AAA protease yme1 [Oleoguttula sp. CCFEE 5521]